VKSFYWRCKYVSHHLQVVKESTKQQYLQLQITHSANTIGATQLVAPRLLFENSPIKGNVQQKQRWVESGIIRRVWALSRGTGNIFFVLGGLHLVLPFFCFCPNYRQVLEE
jgi:hypothetical protein